jgi:biopolymer transport protein ExbB
MATTTVKAPAAKPKSKNTGFKGIKAAWIVMVVCFAIALCFYLFVLGNPNNFQGGDPANQPVQGNLLGTMYKGGFMVPIILTCLLTDFAIIIERYFALRTAFGKTSLVKFVADIKVALAKNDLDAAQKLCDKQRGSVSNVVSATLRKYKEMEENTVLTKEQKVLAIQKELEESTALEMPMLQQNLPILATLTTLGTLFGLFGTVMGMIRSFASLAGEGGTDSAMLSVGISEALVNTACGIATAAFALIGYNFYTNKIDKLTFSLDEVGFTIVQTFSATH